MTNAASERALAHVLLALEQEILQASDEEIGQVAGDLGMNLQMRESAAFHGLTYPARPSLEDFFDPEKFPIPGKLPPRDE